MTMASSNVSLLLVSVLAFASQSLGQRLSFLRLPSSISLSSSSPSPLDAHEQLEPLIANLLGLSTPLDWPGLTTYSTLDRPKANLLFVVEGVDDDDVVGSTSGLGGSADGVELENAVAEDAVDAFRGLGLRLQSTFKESPLLLHNALDSQPEVASLGSSLGSSASDVNSAFQLQQNSVDQLGGALKMKQLLNPRHLNISESADAEFLSELSFVQLLVDSLRSSSDLKRLVDDATPDSILFRFRSLQSLVDAHGSGSAQLAEAKTLLKEFIVKITKKVEKIYEDKAVVVELITLPAGGAAAPAAVLRRRERAAAAANAAVNVRAAAAAVADKTNNLAPPYDWNYAATFNMSIWTGIVLAAIMYLIGFGIWNMDPGRDGYVYRMTMAKNK